MDSDNLALLLTFALIVVIFICAFISSKIEDKKKKHNDEIANKYGVSFEKSVLRLNSKGSGLSEIIKIVKEGDYSIGYKPEEVHFGAATVGGVTTGGTYTTGGYHYASGASSSGKYSLRYLTAKGETIDTIRLSDDLYQQAKESPIADYLDIKQFGIAVLDKNVKYSEAELIELRLFAMGKGGTSHAVHKAYPDYNKCVAIMNWLTQD